MTRAGAWRAQPCETRVELIALHGWGQTDSKYRRSGLSVAAIEILNLTQTGDLFFTSEAGMYHALGLAPLIIATSAGAPILGAMVDRGECSCLRPAQRGLAVSRRRG